MTSETKEALKAKAYVMDTLAGLIPSDSEFDEIWDLIPDHIELTHVSNGAELIDIAGKIREIKNRHLGERLDNFQA